MAHEFGYKLRLLKVLIAFLENPKVYTKKQLAERYNAKEQSIKDDIKVIRDAGFILKYDENYRYYFEQNPPFKRLNNLLYFTEEDQLLLSQAIDNITKYNRRGEYLKNKLGTLYEYHRLGHAYLRKPYLKKIDLLKEAKAEKRVVILKDYRSSNSNTVKDRRVEPFHPSPPDDILHAFDLDLKKLRHFKISRISRIEMTNDVWQFEGHHQVIATDCFRIVNKNQLMVNIRFKVGAYNELLESFPLAAAYVQHTGEDNIYELQCMVNKNFYGLSNFILSSLHDVVEIVSPDCLKVHLSEKMKEFQKKLDIGW
jgi:predicted DNA-binding transcriptional regulator YafY